MANASYQRVTDQIIELLERGVVPWRKPWAGSEQWPKNLVSAKRYRGINPFLLGITAWGKGYESAFWMTYRQAKGRGGHVRKGEKATTIVFWKQWTVDDRDPDTKEPIRKTIPVMRAYSVFNAEQTADVEYPKPDDELIDFSPIERCESVVSGMPNPPTIETGGHQPGYRPLTDSILMPRAERFISAEEYYSTLFHELAHSTGHVDRLDRSGIVTPTQFGSADHAKEELIAEMGASFLCGHCGIDTAIIDNSAAYISGWLRRLRSDNRLAIRAASAAQKATDFILDQDAETVADAA